MKRRLLSLILVLCFAITVVPSAVRADIGETERAAYTAYIDVLQKNKPGIDNYIWQKGYTLEFAEDTGELLPLTDSIRSRPVVLCDIYGDSVPELIYVGDADAGYYENGWYCNDSYIKLHILTYKNGNIVTLYEKDWWGWGDAALTYHLFQLKDSKELYIETAIGDDWFEDVTYRLVEGNDGLLHEKKVCSLGWDDDRDDETITHYYNESGLSISRSNYESIIHSLQENTSGILMYSFLNDAGSSFVKKNGCPAMTCDEAISFLSNKLSEKPITVLDDLLTTSTEYNNNLALIAAELSLATYTGNSSHSSDKDVKAYLKNLGFADSNMYSNNYGGSLAYTVASKSYAGTGADGVLVIVAQGTTNRFEAVMDAMSGSGERINGQETYDIVRDFYKDIMKGIQKVTESGKEYRTLICGHSLGGAAANLVAASLTRGWYGQANVFCYTFGAIDPITNKTLQTKGYENIHNVYNKLDTWSPYQYGPQLGSGVGQMYGKFGEINYFIHEYRVGSELKGNDVQQMRDSVNHKMENYIAAIRSGEIEANRWRWKRGYSAVACPVDVCVYRDGVLVGKTENNIVSLVAGDVEIAIESDVKFIYYPDDTSYELRITAYDSGRMSYSVCNPKSGTIYSVQDIELYAGKSFSTEAGNTKDVSQTKIYVLDSSGTPVRTVNSDGTEAVLSTDQTANVSTTSAPSPTVSPAPVTVEANSAPQAYVTIVNVRNKLSVRRDASADTSRLGYAYNGEVYPLLAVKGKWYKIQYKTNVVGYVHGDYVQATNEHLVPHSENNITPKPTATPTKRPTSTPKAGATEPPPEPVVSESPAVPEQTPATAAETDAPAMAEEDTPAPTRHLIVEAAGTPRTEAVEPEDGSKTVPRLGVALIGISGVFLITLIGAAALITRRSRARVHRIPDDTDDFEEI